MDDLISRQAAIDALYRVDECNGWSIEAIRGLPSAQPSFSQRHENDHVADVSKMDWISRAEAIDALSYCQTYLFDSMDKDKKVSMEDVIYALEQLPSAQPEQRWIPWDSGKFPEESGTYTVTAYDGATKRVTYAKYQKRLKRWELTGARAYWRVLAWMPLPEPWKEGET